MCDSDIIFIILNTNYFKYFYDYDIKTFVV